MTLEYVVAIWLTAATAQCEGKACTVVPPHEGIRYHIVDQHLESCVINDGDKPAMIAARIVGKRIEILMGEGIRPCVGPSS